MFITDPDDSEARSTLALALVIGQHFMAADHGTRSKPEVFELAASFLLKPPGGP